MKPGPEGLPELISFEEGLALTQNQTRHLLVGNGFSIAARPSIFGYASLHAKASLSYSDDALNLFAARNTHDPEEVMDYLSNLLDSGRLPPIKEARARELSDEIRSVFVETLSSLHPRGSHSLREQERAFCAEFLGHFIRDKKDRLAGRIFTTNYDLLLTWVTASMSMQVYDGFRPAFDNHEVSEWDENGFPNLLYLHGALHIFREGSRYRILRYRHGRLMDQVRAELDRGRLPLMVTEGTSNEKYVRTLSEAYCAAALKKWNSTLHTKNSSLFLFGHGLGLRDQHFFERVGSSRIAQVFIGLYEGAASPAAARAAQLAKEWGVLRARSHPDHPLKVCIYDTAKVPVWRQVGRTAPDAACTA